jgi:hypothetical protein
MCVDWEQGWSCKWICDGSKSIAEMSKALREEADSLDEMAALV